MANFALIVCAICVGASVALDAAWPMAVALIVMLGAMIGAKE